MQYSKDEESLPPQEDELPDLNEKQRLFVFGIAKGLSASESYRVAYGCDGWTPESVWTAASRLKNHPNIQRWLSIRKTETIKELGYTKEQAMQDLEDIKQRAASEGKYIAFINATQLQCKIVGHVGDQKQEDKGRSQSDSLLAQISKQFGPEMAQVAAKKLGLESETVH